MGQGYSTQMSAEELLAATESAVRNGRSDTALMLYALRMIRDANHIADPIAKADRFNLAMTAFQKAATEAEAIAKRTGIQKSLQQARNAVAAFEGQYVELSLACLDAYHEERKATLAKSNSGKRQLASARATLKKLKRLETRYTEGPLAERFGTLWAYWQDQEVLLRQYGD